MLYHTALFFLVKLARGILALLWYWTLTCSWFSRVSSAIFRLRFRDCDSMCVALVPSPPSSPSSLSCMTFCPRGREKRREKNLLWFLEGGGVWGRWAATFGGGGGGIDRNFIVGQLRSGSHTHTHTHKKKKKKRRSALTQSWVEKKVVGRERETCTFHYQRGWQNAVFKAPASVFLSIRSSRKKWDRKLGTIERSRTKERLPSFHHHRSSFLPLHLLKRRAAAAFWGVKEKAFPPSSPSPILVTFLIHSPSPEGVGRPD